MKNFHPPSPRGGEEGGNYSFAVYLSSIRPSVEIVTTCHGMNLPLA